MKICTKCKEVKDFSCFYLEKRWKNCYRSLCKKCYDKNNIPRVKKWYAKNGVQYRIINKQKYGIGINTIRRLGLQTALFIYDRDKRKCTICKDENDLTIDHIDGNGRHNLEKGLPMNNDLDNLRILCRRCHGSISGKLSWSKHKK